MASSCWSIWNFTPWDPKLCKQPKVALQKWTLMGLNAEKVAESHRLCKRNDLNCKGDVITNPNVSSIQAIPCQCHCHFLFIIPTSLQFKSFPPTHDTQHLVFFCWSDHIFFIFLWRDRNRASGWKWHSSDTHTSHLVTYSAYVLMNTCIKDERRFISFCRRLL